MTARLTLEKRFELPDFPSGSSINFKDQHFFLIGDDANTILVLDTAYKRIDSQKLFDFTENRIPKPVKADLETSTIFNIGGRDFLMILGSASTEKREKVFIIPFLESNLDTPHFRIIQSDVFASRLLAGGVGEVNIEGSAVLGKKLLLSNRGNRKNVTNHVIVTAVDFWEDQAAARLKIVPVKVPEVAGDAPGISELCYVDGLDLLLMSFSSERTDNAYDDGAIGDSYIGWVENISKKMQTSVLTVDDIINLSDVHTDFRNEKIEGLCVEVLKGRQITLHLVSDNDNGQSRLFKVNMTLND